MLSQLPSIQREHERPIMTIPDAYNVNMASTASTTAATRARARGKDRGGRDSNQSTDESAYGPPIVMVSWHPTKEAIAFLIGQSRHASTVWIWQHRFGLRKLQRSELIKLLHPKGKIDEPNPITADIKEW